MSAPHSIDPWAGGPRRGAFVLRSEISDPEAVRAARADPSRQWVTICPLWFGGIIESLAEIQDQLASGDLDPLDLDDVLTGLAADVWALACGYAGANVVDLTDPVLPDVVVAFLTAALDRRAPPLAELLPGWSDALADAFHRLS